jgi:hypothetical protein
MILANKKAVKLVTLAKKKAEKEKERCKINVRALISTVKRLVNSLLKKPPRRRFMY